MSYAAGSDFKYPKEEVFIMMNEEDMEKYSSAVTLSDMEIFIFPELL